MSPEITERESLTKIGKRNDCVDNNSCKAYVVKKIERDPLFRGMKYGHVAIWVLFFFLCFSPFNVKRWSKWFGFTCLYGHGSSLANQRSSYVLVLSFLFCEFYCKSIIVGSQNEAPDTHVIK